MIVDRVAPERQRDGRLRAGADLPLHVGWVHGQCAGFRVDDDQYGAAGQDRYGGLMGAVAEFVLYGGEVSHGLLPPVAFHLVGQGSFGHR
jgi:hypothetical protein